MRLSPKTDMQAISTVQNESLPTVATCAGLNPMDGGFVGCELHKILDGTINSARIVRNMGYHFNSEVLHSELTTHGQVTPSTIKKSNKSCHATRNRCAVARQSLDLARAHA